MIRRRTDLMGRQRRSRHVATPADSSVAISDQLPVISLSFAKNARLRWVLIPQFTGGD